MPKIGEPVTVILKMPKGCTDCVFSREQDGMCSLLSNFVGDYMHTGRGKPPSCPLRKGTVDLR